MGPQGTHSVTVLRTGGCDYQSARHGRRVGWVLVDVDTFFSLSFHRMFDDLWVLDFILSYLYTFI